MHNGGLAEFPKYKRKLQQLLPDQIFNEPLGNTGMYKIHSRFIVR